MAKTLTQTLADSLASFSLSQLEPATLDKARYCLLDYFAAAWNGYGHPLFSTYHELAFQLGGPGASPVIGETRATQPSWAVFANGSASHITEVDDMSRLSTMHTGICVTPVTLALAFEKKLPGDKILESLVCGYEAGLRMGECLGRTHYAIFHTTGTAGTFGAAAAAAKALNLNAEQTAHALGHAGTQAMALWQFLEDGAFPAKPLHSGKAAQDGLTAAYLAAAGVPGAHRILEGKKGYFSFASSAPKPEAITQNLGKTFKVDEVSFKSYPTCGQTQSMLDATRAIIREHGITAADVKEVEARVYEQAVTIAGIADPQTLEQAKFSNQVCMALMLVKGDLTFANMTLENVNDPAVRDLSRRVKLVLDPEVDAKFPATRPCRIIVRAHDGRELVRENYYRTGDPEHPMSAAQMESKFRDLSGHVLSREKQDRIINWCLGLPQGTLTEELFRP